MKTVLKSVQVLKRSLLALCLTVVSWGYADVQIDIVIEDGMNFARPVAILPFKMAEGVRPPHDIANIIASDLRRSGRFNPLAFNDFPENPLSAQTLNRKLWKQKGVEAVVMGSVSLNINGEFEVNYQLVDIFKDPQVDPNSNVIILNATGSSNSTRYRFYSHQVADNIYQALTGERGAFATRIAYVVVDRTQKKPYQLFIADSDGFNPQALYTSYEAIMSPSWSPDGRAIAYTSFENGRSEVYLQQIYSGNRDLLAAFPGINSGAVFSPDGKKIALTLSKDGNSEIYVMELATRKYKRLTYNPLSIEISPQFSPDGQFIMYASDQTGLPQIYRVPVNGGRAERITFEGELNDSPQYTPDGKSIVVVNRTNGTYRIAVQDLSSGILQVLTDTQLDESPSLAPNGSMVIYATIYNGRQVLAAVSTDGRFKARLPSKQGEVKAPAWSPYLFN